MGMIHKQQRKIISQLRGFDIPFSTTTIYLEPSKVHCGRLETEKVALSRVRAFVRTCWMERDEEEGDREKRTWEVGI